MFLTSLRARLANIERTQWIGAAVALGAVLFIASLFVVEALYGYWKPEPEIVYVQSWDGDRSYEDALAAQEEERRIADAAETAADQLAAEASQRAQVSRDTSIAILRNLAGSLGMLQFTV